ncbi:MAG: type IV pilus modification protein PilV [Aquabacterium sp.]|nr:type IV pilus modification protein PilV [Aquabacterium sp.]
MTPHPALAPARSRRPRRRGIALMEAMIAMVLLSIGALGYAALQLKGLSASSSAMWRSKSSNLAYDMADRMRANRAGAVAGAYNNLGAPQVVTDCGTAADCSPVRMALLDHAQWNATLANELPGGSGVVCLDTTPDDGTAASTGCDGAGNMLAVKVFWTERGVPARQVLGVRP